MLLQGCDHRIQPFPNSHFVLFPRKAKNFLAENLPFPTKSKNFLAKNLPFPTKTKNFLAKIFGPKKNVGPKKLFGHIVTHVEETHTESHNKF